MVGVRPLLRLLLGRGLLLPGQLLRVGAEPLHLDIGLLAIRIFNTARESHYLLHLTKPFLYNGNSWTTSVPRPKTADLGVAATAPPPARSPAPLLLLPGCPQDARILRVILLPLSLVGLQQRSPIKIDIHINIQHIWRRCLLGLAMIFIDRLV